MEEDKNKTTTSYGNIIVENSGNPKSCVRKCFKKTHRHWFVREASILNLLNTLSVPNVCRMISYSTSRMEIDIRYIPGRDLMDLLIEEPFSMDFTLQLFSTSAKILSAIHKAGIIHNDVKLENMILSEPDTVSHLYFIDFGYSEYSIDDICTFNAGTENYIPIEKVLFKKGDVFSGQKSDIFSLGVCYHCLIYQEFPWHQPSRYKHVKATGKEMPVDYPQIPKVSAAVSDAIILLIKSMLNPDPKKRPQLYQIIGYIDFLRKLLSKEQKST